MGGGLTFLSPKIEAAVPTEPYASFYCFVTTHFSAVTATQPTYLQLREWLGAVRQNKNIISTHDILCSLYQFTVMVYSDINIILLSRSRPCPFIFLDCSCVCISVSPVCAKCLTHFISLVSTLGMYSCVTRKTNEIVCRY